MHIAQGVLRAINVNKLTSTGCVFKFWVADWFAQLNNKMDGDLNKIKTVGLYMIEIWKAIGMNMQNVQFLWASDEINAHAEEYWTRVMDIARCDMLFETLFYMISVQEYIISSDSFHLSVPLSICHLIAQTASFCRGYFCCISE